MKKLLATLIFSVCCNVIYAQQSKDIQLKAPQKKAGAKVMQALNERKSTRSFDSKELDLQTLSNLLWAANGINRPDGKRTAPSALNRQEVEIYVCLKSGAYFYNPQENKLEYISDAKCLQRNAPATLYLAAKVENDIWAYVDTGIVSQNISVFAAAFGLATVPQGRMDKEQVRKDLNLPEEKQLILNHPVGYPKKDK